MNLENRVIPWQYKLTNETEYDSEKITIILLNLKTDKGNLFELNAAKEISKYQKNDVDEGDDTESKKAMKKTEMIMTKKKAIRMERMMNLRT